MIRSVLVAGGGSAGLLAALILRKQLPQLNIALVRSKEIGVIGVGESTTVAIPRILHGFLELEPTDFYRRVLPSWKLGIRFLWGERPYFDYTFDYQMEWKWNELRRPNGYYCDDDFTYASISSALMSHNMAFERQANGMPYMNRNIGYHIENQRFVSYLEAMAAARGIKIIDGVIAGATQDDNGITGVQLESGETLTADLYVDSTGFRSLLLGKTLKEPYIPFKATLFCDRAVVGTWQRTDEPVQPYTTAETMTTGWCWRIDHPDCIMRGYVYSSAFISDEDAEREFRARNPKVTKTRIVYFVTGRHERVWVKNVVGIGNASGFVEPLESTALAVICDQSRILAESLDECECAPTPVMVNHLNRTIARVWDQIRDFLGIHYKFNTRYNNEFWRACWADTKLGAIQELLDYYESQGPSIFYRCNLVHGNDIFGMEGYLALLVGQKVPYRAKYQPSESERQIWRTFQQTNRRKAETGYTVPDALKIVTAQECRWQPGFFRNTSGAQLTSYIGPVG